jgi:lipopolysaccharide/colanic/teichoic acid biosynthesis glycosyltransferase
MQSETTEAAMAFYASPTGTVTLDDDDDRDVVPSLVPTRAFEASAGELLLKRTLDVLAASLVVLLVLPVLIVAAVGVRISSSGPIFFRQTRVGRGGRTFTMFKFRTYPVEHVDAAVALPVNTCPSRWGRLLRRTSIDELPQLLNVIKGEMSLVGPRPERPQFATPLADEHPAYRERHRMPAGITGLAQISGLVGTTSIADRIEADNQYIDGWSFGRDLAILFRTVPAVLKKIHW